MATDTKLGSSGDEAVPARLQSGPRGDGGLAHRRGAGEWTVGAVVLFGIGGALFANYLRRRRDGLRHGAAHSMLSGESAAESGAEDAVLSVDEAPLHRQRRQPQQQQWQREQSGRAALVSPSESTTTPPELPTSASAALRML